MLYQDSPTAQTDLSDPGALPAPRHMAAQATDQTLSNAKTATTALSLTHLTSVVGPRALGAPVGLFAPPRSRHRRATHSSEQGTSSVPITGYHRYGDSLGLELSGS